MYGPAMVDPYRNWQRDDVDAAELRVVTDIAERLHGHLQRPEVQAAIALENVPRAHSYRIQIAAR